VPETRRFQDNPDTRNAAATRARGHEIGQ
jgi:hypothetical protein